MAKIIFTLDEAIPMIVSNINLPEQITDIKADKDSISFKLNTGIPLVKSISASVRYIRYENGIGIFEMNLPLQSIVPMQKIINKVTQRFSKEIPEEVKFDYPNIFVDINKLVEKKTKGINVDNIVYENENFVIEFCNV